MDLAYLDAGSGSLIVQAVVAGTAGVAVAAKLYWRRLTSVFRRKEQAASTGPAEAPTSPAPTGAESAATSASGATSASTTGGTGTAGSDKG